MRETRHINLGLFLIKRIHRQKGLPKNIYFLFADHERLWVIRELENVIRGEIGSIFPGGGSGIRYPGCVGGEHWLSLKQGDL